MKMNKSVLLTDLPNRVVGGFRPARGVGEGWVAVDFATEDYRGTGVATGFASGARELAIRLGLRGSYVLYLGLGSHGSIRVWLDGEKGFREFVCGHGAWRILEARLHQADLTGRNLHIAPMPSSRYSVDDGHMFLAYVRAVPVDHAPSRSARNLVATNDGYSWIALDGMASIRDVTKQFEPYRDSDFFRMLWCPVGADVTGNHLTRVGTVTPFNFTHAYRRCDREFAATTKRILKSGGDILKAAVAAAREVGMEIHFYFRPEAFFAPFPYDGVFTSKFLARSPQWRCRDESGRPVNRMSYAWREVQDHMLAYIEELLQYQPDGICFAFNRSLPMMICEQPVIEAFRQRHGRAPKLPKEVDSPEMLAVRHEILAQFIGRLQDVLRPRGKSFSCIVEFDQASNRLLGLNIEDLLSRKLVESVYLTGFGPRSNYWRGLQRKYPVSIYSSIPHEDAPIRYDHRWQAKQLKAVLKAGFAGTFWWDTEGMHRNPYNWHVLRHGGNQKFLDRVLTGDSKTEVVLRPVTEVRGVRLDRYNPMRSY